MGSPIGATARQARVCRHGRYTLDPGDSCCSPPLDAFGGDHIPIPCAGCGDPIDSQRWDTIYCSACRILNAESLDLLEEEDEDDD